LKALLSYFTILPVSGASLEKAAREVHFLPLIGVITGLPAALLLLSVPVVPPGVASTLALGVVLVAAGLHHADGVLDVGDALMVRGTPERRREVLKDARVGIGGIGALFVVYAPTVAALAALCAASSGRAALTLLAGEVAARSVMVLTLAYGEPADAGSSAVPFVRHSPDRATMWPSRSRCWRRCCSSSR
jgi:adenosylcobinamide-GDP ribazoletransferase